MQGPLPVLMGRRVLLREPRAEDGAALFRYTSDPEVTRFLALDPPGTIDDTLYFIARCGDRREQGSEYVFVIADVTSDEPVGIICLRHIDPAMRTAQIGTWLGRERWGSGANAEAKRLLLDFAFDRLRLHRVEARIAVANGRSMRAFERLGAEREGVLRESFFKDGAYHDQHLYVILEQEWRGRPRRDAVKTGGHND
jgi:RimJ/RimL family protein N-acetyltransferase